MSGETRRFFESIAEMFKSPKSDGDDVSMLLESVKNEIRETRSSIDNVKDETALDMYLYRLKAAEAQYRHLLKMAKEDRQKKTG